VSHIRVTGIIKDEIGTPTGEGVGGDLYSIPFQLTHAPSDKWVSLFEDCWDFPPHASTMHRPGIAKVKGDRIILTRTTIEEVEAFHLQTLKDVIGAVNIEFGKRAEEEALRDLARHEFSKQHSAKVSSVISRLKFDDGDEP